VQPFRIYLTPTSDASFQSIVYDSPAGQAAPVEMKLPFFDQENDRRITILKVLESRTFQSQTFQTGNEQQWLVQIGLLDSSDQAFHPHRFEIIGQALYQCLFPSGSGVLPLEQTTGGGGSNRS
jgi:hypothetical protein